MKVIFPVKIYQKFRAYIDNSNNEISGLGKISRLNDIITIEDIKIFKQTASPTETTLNKNDLGMFYDEIVQKGESLVDWKLWWHSHALMKAYFSSVDLDTIEDFDNDLSENNWMLSIVSNHDGDLLARIDVFSPIRCTMHQIDWEIDFRDQQTTLNAINEIKEKVNKKSAIIIPPKKNAFFPKTQMKMIDGKMVIVNPQTGLPF
jgi:proteasome lid subunit RPN8/RPN11